MGKQALGRLLVLLAIAAVAPACGGGGGGKRVPGTVTVNIISSTTSEDQLTTASFTVALSKKPTRDVTIAVSSSNTLEGDVDKASLTFTKLNWNVPQTVTVTGADDFKDDGNVGYTIVLAPCVSLDKAFNGVDPIDVNIINNDNDDAGFIFSAVDGLTTSEAPGGVATFTVKLKSEPTSSVTFTLTSDNILEGTVSPSSLTFDPSGPNAWDQLQTVTITGVNGDAIADGDVIYHIVTGVASGGGPGYDLVNPQDVEVTNTDNDQAGITVNTGGSIDTSESGTTDTFTVALSSQPTATVTVTVSSIEISPGVFAGLLSTTGSAPFTSSVILTFTTLDWNTPQTVTVQGQNDLLPKKNPPVVYTIRLDASSPGGGGDAAYEALADKDISATNTDNDPPGFTVDIGDGLVVSETGSITDTFTVRLNTIPSSDVTLSVTVSNLNEGTVDQTTLVFLGNNTSALDPLTVKLTGVADSTVDGDQNYTITIAVDPVTTEPDYLTVGPQDIDATTTDNDGAGFILSGNANSLITFENGPSDSFTVALSSIPSSSITVTFTATVNGDEVTVTPTLTFPATTAALIAQPVTVTGVDDFILDGNISFTITGTVTAGTDPGYTPLTITATGTNTDDEVPPPPGATGWTKPPSTGIPLGTAGAWDDKYTQEPSVLKLGPTSYVMWYEGANATKAKHEQVGRATSTDGLTWVKDAAPVLTYTSANGTFDKNGAGDPSVYFDGAGYHMWYAGRENAATKNKIGYATSPDGIGWSRENGGSPVLSGTGGTFDSVGVYGPMVIFDGVSTYHMWYTGLDAAGIARIGHATSTNGIAWSKTAGAVLNTGTAGAFDAFAVKLCAVIQDGATYRMWYVGTDVTGPSGRQRIGYASAAVTDLGLNWTKFAGNPSLTSTAGTFDERNLWGPWVIKDGTVFKMWYGGEDNTGVIRIGYAEIP